MMMPRALNSLKIRYEIGSRQWRQSRLRNRHLADLPTLNPFDRALLADLERDGAAITSLAALAANGDCKAFDLQAARDILLVRG